MATPESGLSILRRLKPDENAQQEFQIVLWLSRTEQSSATKKSLSFLFLWDSKILELNTQAFRAIRAFGRCFHELLTRVFCGYGVQFVMYGSAPPQISPKAFRFHGQPDVKLPCVNILGVKIPRNTKNALRTCMIAYLSRDVRK